MWESAGRCIAASSLPSNDPRETVVELHRCRKLKQIHARWVADGCDYLGASGQHLGASGQPACFCEGAHHCSATAVAIVVRAMFEPEDHCLPADTPPAALIVGRFLNTVDYRTFGDHGRAGLCDRLSSPAEFQKWLRKRELLTEGRTPNDGDLVLAHVLRARLRTALGDPIAGAS